MKVWVVLSGYAEDYSEYGTLADEEFVGIALTEKAAASLAKSHAEKLYKDYEEEYDNVEGLYVASNHDPIIPDGAYIVKRTYEETWFYWKEFELHEEEFELHEEETEEV